MKIFVESHKVEVTGEKMRKIDLCQQQMTLNSYFKVVHNNLCFMNFLLGLKQLYIEISLIMYVCDL